jgi:proline iminopeptidase
MTETFIDSTGARLWSITEGAGLPVVLCHGGPGCCDYLAPVADLLTDQAQVIRYEQRGCGRSTAQPPYDLETALLDLDRVRRHYGFERWVVGGHSWGADLALLYSLHYPAHTHAMLCLAGGRFHSDREWHALYHERQDAGLEPPLAWAYPPNLEVNAALNAAMHRYRRRPTLYRELADLAIPALFIYGDQDIRPHWPIEQIAHLLPQARFELLSGANHYLWHTHAAQLRQLMTHFLHSIASITPATYNSPAD